jgi:predicted enzyme related to lactoylglutathione lyase
MSSAVRSQEDARDETGEAARSADPIKRLQGVEMTQGFGLIVYPVKDIAVAKAVYSTLLGTEPYADTPYYVGFRVGDQEVGLDPNGHAKGMTGPLAYWQVDDVKQALQALVDAGVQVQQEVTEVGGGKLVASVADADGNVTGLLQSA